MSTKCCMPAYVKAFKAIVTGWHLSRFCIFITHTVYIGKYLWLLVLFRYFSSTGRTYECNKIVIDITLYIVYCHCSCIYSYIFVCLCIYRSHFYYAKCCWAGTAADAAFCYIHLPGYLSGLFNKVFLYVGFFTYAHGEKEKRRKGASLQCLAFSTVISEQHSTIGTVRATKWGHISKTFTSSQQIR